MSSVPAHPSPPRSGGYLASVCLIALGVVYGDIGTSPLYALRECFFGAHAVTPTPDHITGVLSLIFWALIIVISIKYLTVVLRADNRGEGGILSLMALATPIKPTTRLERPALVMLAMFGAALLYSDGVITPAISVLGAMEGLSVATPEFSPYVAPGAIAVLVALFLFQKRGTAGVGRVFGPVMLVWFLVLAVLGVLQIARNPSVLAAVNPMHAMGFFVDTGWRGYMVVGSVFLAVTGGEALYADMGHFGAGPIRIDWFTVVLPSLLLNYFGQGALLLETPEAATNPFYLMAPSWALHPMVVLAVLAAAIASQAVISGAYSLTMQAVRLGFSPRMKIDHTSAREYGQVYIGAINWALMAGCIVVVLAFRTSNNLAAAYGVAVSSTMLITTLLVFVVARERWRWGVLKTAAIVAAFLVVDLAFFGANIVKVAEGGWLPLVLAAIGYTVMTTWRRGRRLLAWRLQAEAPSLTEYLEQVRARPVARVPGSAVFMNGTASRTPQAFHHNLEHNKVLHERVVFVTVKTGQTPFVNESDRIEIESFGDGFHRVRVYYGYMEQPDVPKALAAAAGRGLPPLNPAETTYFLGRETIVASRRPGMARWREHLFSLMSRNATTATAYFGIPPSRVIEVGEQIEI